MNLLSHIESWVVELERVVSAFEAAVDEVEDVMDKVEQSNECGDEDEQKRLQQELAELKQLESALEASEQVAALVHAANTTLSDAIDAVSVGMQYIESDSEAPLSDTVKEYDPDRGRPQGSPPLPTATPAPTMMYDGDGDRGRPQGSPPFPTTTPAPTMTTEYEPDGGRVSPGHVPPLPTATPALTMTTEYDPDGGRPQGSPPLPTATPALTMTTAIPPQTHLSSSSVGSLPNGSLILGGRYRLVQLLHSRPRLHLYLAQRVGADKSTQSAINRPLQGRSIGSKGVQQPMVVIRELVLVGLHQEMRKQIEQAAFEEFVSPVVLGSPRLPGTGDRIHIENDRHYLVMQLRPARGVRQAVAVTLAELLLSRPQWPSWLGTETALEWGVQLCRIVARLHRLGVVLGDLNPATVLVDSEGAAEWAPVLLVSWPPAPEFWRGCAGYKGNQSINVLYKQIFPIDIDSADNAFAAPETLKGTCDQRSDVYSLGAILYLLLTRYAPVAAALRERAEQGGMEKQGENKRKRVVSGPLQSAEGMELIPPHLFNSRISPALEQILVKALALRPAERYASVFALVEELEAVDPEHDLVDVFTQSDDARKERKVGKVIEWLKQELS